MLTSLSRYNQKLRSTTRRQVAYLTHQSLGFGGALMTGRDKPGSRLSLWRRMPFGGLFRPLLIGKPRQMAFLATMVKNPS